MIRRLITAAAGMAIALTVALPLATPAGAAAVHKKTTCTTEGGDFFNNGSALERVPC